LAITLLSGPADLLRAYAAADADWSSYKQTQDVLSLRRAADRLCEAGQGLLEDHGFWAALETELGVHVGPAWLEFVEHRQDFLNLELAIVVGGGQMKESEAVALMAELEGAIATFVTVAETSEGASYIIQTGAFRSRFETLNNSVCAARNASLQTESEPPRNVLRRMGSAIFRSRKVVGGIGLIGLNSAVGAGTIVIPFAAPITAGIVSGSIVGGITTMLS
jgi:hypothetical protein